MRSEPNSIPAQHRMARTHSWAFSRRSIFLKERNLTLLSGSRHTAPQAYDQEPAAFPKNWGGGGGCTQSVGSLGGLQAFDAVPLCLGASDHSLCWLGSLAWSQLQSRLEDTACPGSDTQHRFQHMAPERRHPHHTFSSKTDAYQTPTPPSNTLLGSAHLKNPKPTGGTHI